MLAQMNKIVIFTDGATLELVRQADDATDPHESPSLLSGRDRFHPCESGREQSQVDKDESAGERLDFAELKDSASGRRSSARKLADRITEILRQENVECWHLVAPPQVKKLLTDLLDDDMRRSLRRIGFGDLVAAADGAPDRSHSPTW